MTTDPATTSAVPQYNTFDEYIESQAVDVVAGYDLVDKATLVGVPFIITEATFRPGDYDESGDYVSCQCLTRDNAHVVFNDGSTGIRRQILDYCEAKGIFKSDEDDVYRWYDPASITFDDSERPTVTVPMALLSKRGLRVSEYKYRDPKDGKEKPATTYYLA